MRRCAHSTPPLLSAASLQDWKFLAARDDGDDEYVNGESLVALKFYLTVRDLTVPVLCGSGDILRATGNLAGKSASMVMRKVGKGIGEGVSNVTHKLGDGIEDATGKIGARKLGAGVNSVVSGVGDGVGTTLTGGKTMLSSLVSCSCNQKLTFLLQF